MDPQERKRVLRLLSNGMYVVTTQRAGEPAGATVTWLTQTSFEPPLLVAGVRPGSGLSEGMQESGRAIVHVLGEGQQPVAKKFFSRPEVDNDADPPTIAGLPFEPVAAGPLLLDVRAWAEVRVIETVDCGGDHNLVVLEVVEVGHRGEIEPLTVRSSPWEYGG